MRKFMSIKILNIELTNQIKEVFDKQLIHPVELIYFYNQDTCETCEETGQLLDEISELSTKLKLTRHVLEENLATAEKYNIHLVPSLVIAGDGESEPVDYGVRFSGIPAGYEFGSLIQAIVLVSKRDSGLRPAVRDQLKQLDKPIHLQVFVTPT
jgi:alkyl hydroperoxide reductase subunit AhpF